MTVPLRNSRPKTGSLKPFLTRALGRFCVARGPSASTKSAGIRRSPKASAVRSLIDLARTVSIFPMLLLGGAVAYGESQVAAKPKDLTDLPIEELMNIDVPKVYAASKIEQKTTEAP